MARCYTTIYNPHALQISLIRFHPPVERWHLEMQPNGANGFCASEIQIYEDQISFTRKTCTFGSVTFGRDGSSLILLHHLFHFIAMQGHLGLQNTVTWTGADTLHQQALACQAWNSSTMSKLKCGYIVLKHLDAVQLCSHMISAQCPFGRLETDSVHRNLKV